MSINREATIRWKGYDPDDLKPKSNKRVWVICDVCGDGRWVRMADCYDDLNLCLSCSIKQKAIDDPTFTKRRGEKISIAFTDERKEEYRERMKDNNNENIERRQQHSIFVTENNPMNDPDIRQKHLKICQDPNMCERRSKILKNSDAVKSSHDKQRGGHDIVGHHYIYDHSDLSKYTMEITRSKHARIHGWMRKAGIKVPHINEVV